MGKKIKIRWILFCALAAFSVLFFAFLFSPRLFVFRHSFDVFAVYLIASLSVLLFGLEDAKKDGGGLREIPFFALSLGIAAASEIFFSRLRNLHSGSGKMLLVLAFACPTMMFFYEIVYWISKAAFRQRFEFAGKFDLFERPADWILSAAIICAGIASSFFIAQTLDF